MNPKHNILTIGVAALLIATVLSTSDPELIERNFNENLVNLIARSGPQMHRNSDNFSYCLASYLSQINAASEKYKEDHAACCADADGKRDSVDAACLASRESLANRTEASCAELQHCKRISSVDQVYQCYMVGGNDKAKVLYGVSNDASFELANYLEQIRIIKNKETICIGRCKETYEFKNIAVYDEFNDCLQGRVKPSPSTTPAPTPSPQTTTANSTTTVKS